MTREKILILLGSVCLALMLVVMACAAPAPSPVTPRAWEWPNQLIVGTLGVGSAAQAITSGIGPALEESTGMRVRVIPDWIETRVGQSLCEYKDFDMSVSGLSIITAYLTGDMACAGMQVHQVRVLWPQSEVPFGQMVRGDSDLKTIYDLKEKKGIRVGTIPAGPFTTRVTYEALPAFLDMTAQEIEEHWEIVPLSNYAEEVRAVGEGKVDVGLNISPISGVTIEVDAGPQGTRWLGMPLEDTAGWARFLEVESTVIPGIITTGVESAHGILGYMNVYPYFVSADQDEELVYHLAKWFGENYDLYEAVSPYTAAMEVDAFRSFLDVCPLPVHEGTIRYLKEIGRWAPEDDKWNEEAVELNTKYVEASKAAFAEANDKGITIDYENQEWLDLWASHKASLPIFKARVG